MAKGDSLYDNAKSEKSEPKKAAPKEEKVEPKNEKGQTQGEERDDVSDKSPNGEESEKGEDKGIEEMMTGFKKLLASHESERRDHHNNHREALRQMGNRHAKSIKDHFSMAMDKMGGEGGGEAPAGEGAPAAAPPAGGAPAPAAEA